MIKNVHSKLIRLVFACTIFLFLHSSYARGHNQNIAKSVNGKPENNPATGNPSNLEKNFHSLKPTTGIQKGKPRVITTEERVNGSMGSMAIKLRAMGVDTIAA